MLHIIALTTQVKAYCELSVLYFSLKIQTDLLHSGNEL